MKKTLLAAAVLALVAAPSFAGTLTDNINVVAVVTDVCSELVADDIDFGSHSASNTDYTQPSMIHVTCNAGIAYNVELDSGINPTGTTNQRRVADATSGEFMDYKIYQPAASDPTGGTGATTKEWGSVADNLQYNNTGTGTRQNFVDTGVITYTDVSSAGTYTDLVVATLNF